MNYLEIKLDVKIVKTDTSSFVSNVIQQQQTLGGKNIFSTFEHEKLKELGFIYNPTTCGYNLEKNFTIKELEFYAREVSKLVHHIVTHGYLIIKIYKNRLYIWDTALIYEGIDTFEYCLTHHNVLKLENLRIVTKSNAINEDILTLCNYTRRYSEPSLDFITQGYFWDKKERKKVKKSSVLNGLEYIKVIE